MHVAIYTRVSTTKQQDGTSLDTQDAACRQFAAEQGWQVTETYRDTYSGANLHDRPALSRLRQQVRARSVQAIICYAIDRLSRNLAHLAILLDECERHGIALHFVTEKLDDSPEGRLLASIRGYVAEIERAKISERTQRGKRAALNAGKIGALSAHPFGYRYNKETGQREIHQPEATIVREAYRLCVEERYSSWRIAREFQARGYPTPQASRGKGIPGKGWYSRTIWMMLRRPDYKGCVYGNALKAELTRSESGRLYRKVTRRDAGEKILLADDCCPIVSPAMWQAAQDFLNENTGDFARNAKRFYLLRGLVFCEKCQYRMQPFRCNGKPYYYCFHASAFETGRCRLMLSAPRLEQEVWDEFKHLLSDPVLLRAALTPDDTSSQIIEADQKALQAQIQKLNQGRQRLLTVLKETNDETLAASIQEQLHRDSDQRRHLEKELEQMRLPVAPPVVDVEKLVEFYTQLLYGETEVLT